MGQKEFWVKKIFGSKKILGQKSFWVKKKFWVKKYFGSKIFGQKKFWSKKFGSEFFFCLKKTGRVNPRGRIYDPPPQKIVGLKLCWVVVSFAW